ncbi:MAG: hypothetical protein JWR14_7023 [Caballeronia sp.]|jgi:hypothetical protein|nr:hypothetical protein [Caballeronia sp.]
MTTNLGLSVRTDSNSEPRETFARCSIDGSPLFRILADVRAFPSPVEMSRKESAN